MRYSTLRPAHWAAIARHALALGVVLWAIDHDPAHSSELEPRALVLTRGADSLGVEGEHFGFTWDRRRGGDLSSIRLHDGLTWHELIEPGVRRTTVPGLLVTGNGRTQSPAFGPGELTVKEERPDLIVIESKAPLKDEKGKESGLLLTQVASVYREGALFIDLVLELPAGSKTITVERASIGVPLATASYTLSFWHWQRSADRGSGFLEAQPMFTSGYCPNVGLALGTSGNLSNQVQMVLESERGLGESLVTLSLREGRSLLHWLHPETAGPLPLVPPYRYTNRLGLLFGRHPTHSRLTGARLAHWIESPGGGMRYPSASAIAALAECGATGVVLGSAWRVPGPDSLTPADADAFAQCQAELKARGLDCLVTLSPGGDAQALGAKARAAGIRGFLLEHGSAHYQTVGGGPETAFPARAMFEWGRALRAGLGPNGIVIQQSGLESPDLTLGLHADGVAFGMEQADWRAARSTLANAYLGGAGFATPCPLLTQDAMRTPRSLAIAAATGSVPLVPLGFGAARSAYAARYALPLWQLMRLIPPGTATEVRTTGVGAAVSASNVDFWSTVYRSEGGQEALVVTSNLSTADQDSTGLAVNLPALGMEGEYDVQMIDADTIEAMQVTFLGRTRNGRMKTDAIARFGVRGFLFTAGDTPAAVAAALDDAVAVGAAVGQPKAPGEPTGLAARPVTGGIALEWTAPAEARPHASSYRIYRSKDPSFRHPLEVATLGDVHETTEFRDFTIAPGERWTYAVAARGPAGQESGPSASATATAPAAPHAWAFSDSAQARAMKAALGSFSWHDSAYGHRCQPDFLPLALSFAPLPDFSSGAAALVVAGSGNHYAGGLIVRSTGPGSGYALLLGTEPGAELVLGKLGRDRIEPIATAAFPRARADREEHSLRFVADGPHLTGYVDDQPLVTASDSTYTRGRVGVLALDGHVHFDNLTVQPASSGGPGGSP